ncbi:MAG: hypothetical protein Q9218_003727 [Villophora microphyllina]
MTLLFLLCALSSSPLSPPSPVPPTPPTALSYPVSLAILLLHPPFTVTVLAPIELLHLFLFLVSATPAVSGSLKGDTVSTIHSDEWRAHAPLIIFDDFLISTASRPAFE